MHQKKKLKVLNYKLTKIIGESKHYPPAIKEWKNSVYHFNKNHLKPLASKDDLIHKLIKSFFNLNDNRKIIRSKRIRDSYLRNSTKRFFVASPEIKQNNEKITVNLYVYNREKEFLYNKLFSLSENLLTELIEKNKIYNIKHSNLKLKNKTLKGIYFIKYNSIFNKIKKGSFYKSFYNNSNFFFGFKLGNKINLLKSVFKTLIDLKEFKFIQLKFFFMFLKYILSIFNLKIRLELLNLKIDKNEKPNIDSRNNIAKLEILSDNKKISFFIKYINEINLFKEINCVLLEYIQFISLDSPNTEYSIQILFNKFYNDNYYQYITKQLNKDLTLIGYFVKLLVNRFKIDKFLPILKNFITKIYSKNVELNIVNLKHPQLNSEIFVESLAMKLKKRLNMFDVLNSSIGLMKFPSKFMFKKDHYNLNKLRVLNFYKSVKVNSFIKNMVNKDILHSTVKNVYPKNTSYNLNNLNYKTNKTMDILNLIKYKWVTGVRLEAKGRLTSRFTASRSAFKLNIQGNLKNIDYSRKTDGINKNIPNLIMRNQINSNLQYAFFKSKRRIGAFGIKGWISNY